MMHASRSLTAPAVLAVGLMLMTGSAHTQLSDPPALPGSDLVRAELVADAEAIAPGVPFRLAIKLSMKDGWHVNWQNPGDAGLAPGIAWELPDGFRRNVPCWPLPGRFRTGPVVIFGYEGELVLPIDVVPPQSLRPGETARFAADVSWLACAEACVPGEAALSLELPVEGALRIDTATKAAIEGALGDCPKPSGEWNVEARVDDSGTIVLDLQTAAEGATALDDVFFYPYEPGYLDNTAVQSLAVMTGPRGRAAYQLRLELSRLATALPERLTGVLVAGRGLSAAGGRRAIEVDVPLARR